MNKFIFFRIPSFILEAKDSDEKPANTILCKAPIRTHAIIHATVIEHVGM